MSTKKLLLVLLPILFIFNNAISFLIFYTSTTTTKSYKDVLSRVLLYESIAKKADEVVNTNYQYILDPSEYSFKNVLSSRAELKSQFNNLTQLSALDEAEISQQRVKQLLSAFLETESKLALALQDKQNLTYVSLYENLNDLSIFITEESYQLIGLELNTYQKWYNKILLEINKIERSGIAILFVNTIISLVLAVWISQRISKPIQKLVTVAERISIGQLDVSPPRFDHHSEFKILSEALDSMQSHVKLLIEKEKEAAEKDKLLTQMELEVLQSQINPHFLFNSLNALSKLALIEGAEKTSDLTVSLSNLFRYNLRQLDRPVPLRDEVEHAKEYFYIQQARFRDRVKFILNIDESLLNTMVPVLTLQPILENIFVHGIEGLVRPAEIVLNIFKKEHYTVIEISDNGVGMDDMTKQTLLNFHDIVVERKESKSNKKSTGLGTKNVFRRIELLYQQHDLIHIHSETHVGTTVTIRIPVTD